jgi:hypothetical protein
MLSSSKILLVAGGFCLCSGFVAGFFRDSPILPPETVHAAMFTCALFVAGLAVGARLFRFEPDLSVVEWRASKGRLFPASVVVLAFLSALIFLTGPTSPLYFALDSSTDSFSLALMREDAVKLNRSEAFIRFYTWTRDFVAPVVCAVCARAVAERRVPWTRLKASIGFFLCLVVGVWSGQKAVVVNYVLAALMVLSLDARDLARRLVPWVLVIAALILLTFAVTQPELSLGSEELQDSIVNRVFWVPLEVTGVYIFCKDSLGTISPWDALPYRNSFTPGMHSLENRVALDFFHQGIDSGHSNAPAFGYAYVLGGFAGAFLAGIWCMFTFWWAARNVRASGMPALVFAFEAYLAYQILDLLNGNYVLYTVKAVLISLALRLGAAALRHRRRLEPPAQPVEAPEPPPA